MELAEAPMAYTHKKANNVWDSIIENKFKYELIFLTQETISSFIIFY